MTLFFLLLVLGVVGAVVAVAAGRITGGLDEAASSLPRRGLPEGSLVADDLDAVRFSPAFRGYRMDEVDAVLDRLGSELRRLEEELRVREVELQRRADAVTPAPGPQEPWVGRSDGSIDSTGAWNARPAVPEHGVPGPQVWPPSMPSPHGRRRQPPAGLESPPERDS